MPSKAVLSIDLGWSHAKMLTHTGAGPDSSRAESGSGFTTGCFVKRVRQLKMFSTFDAFHRRDGSGVICEQS